MIIALASQKGGTAKTTTAAVIWAAFPRSLAIDLDPQGNLAVAVGYNEESQYNIFNVLSGTCKVEDATLKLARGDFITSSPALAGLSEAPKVALSDAIEPLKKNYQHIVIDTPPFLNTLTVEAMAAADMVIIPLQADVFSLRSAGQLADIIDVIREDANPRLRIGGLLLTRLNGRSAFRQQMRELAKEIAADMNTRVFQSTIREGVAIPKAQALGKLLIDYAPKAKVTADYNAFIDELREVLNNG